MSRIALAAPCLLALAAGLPAQEPDESAEREAEAEERLGDAEAAAARGEYWVAVQKYMNLARLYPETRAGRVGDQRRQPNAFLGWSDMVRNGPSENRVDVVLLGDGYMLNKQDEFDRMVEIVPELFKRNEVFGEYFPYLNFIRANLRSAENGVGGYGRKVDTALQGRASGSAQGHVTVDRGLAQKHLEEVSGHDGLALCFVKAGSHGTGGFGIAVIGGRPTRAVVHEWGHAFAGLGDEYSRSTGLRGALGRRPNLSETDDPGRVPWRHWLELGARNVGIHRGGGGSAQGTWKPTVNGCLMDDGQEFCMVCREVLVLKIYEYVDPIEATDPPALGWRDTLRDVRPEFLEVGRRPLKLEVTVMQPDSHDLEVAWWVRPFAEAPRYAGVERRFPDRRRRGPLPPLPGEPADETRANSKGVHRFLVREHDLDPGRYVVICRVRDTTEVRGSRYPWVIRDERGLLESECRWLVEIVGD